MWYCVQIMTIKIILEDRTVEAEIDETRLGKAIWDLLPLKEHGSIWGDEIYFALPLTMGDIENPQDVVEAGDLAYWPPGNAFCVFWGPTPASSGTEIRPASDVEVFGRIINDPLDLKGCRGGTVKLEQIDA
jgi:hypothetical protein